MNISNENRRIFFIAQASPSALLSLSFPWRCQHVRLNPPVTSARLFHPVCNFSSIFSYCVWGGKTSSTLISAFCFHGNINTMQIPVNCLDVSPLLCQLRRLFHPVVDFSKFGVDVTSTNSAFQQVVVCFSFLFSILVLPSHLLIRCEASAGLWRRAAGGGPVTTIVSVVFFLLFLRRSSPPAPIKFRRRAAATRRSQSVSSP